MDSGEYQRILSEALQSIYTRRYFFQQDGATCHTSASTKQFMADRQIKLLPNWPPQSPDLNIIENLWDDAKAMVEKRCPTTIDEVLHFFSEEWEKISAQRIQNLFKSMPQRVKAVVLAKGGNTKY